MGRLSQTTENIVTYRNPSNNARICHAERSRSICETGANKNNAGIIMNTRAVDSATIKQFV